MAGGNNKIQQDRMTVQLDKFARMEANNCTREDKMREIFGIDMKTATPREINNADASMSRWRKHPLYDQVWKEELKSQNYDDIRKAMDVLRDGLRSKDKWLAMQSAINLISNATKRVYAGEDTAVTVKIEGMPDLGTPDGE